MGWECCSKGVFDCGALSVTRMYIMRQVKEVRLEVKTFNYMDL